MEPSFDDSFPLAPGLFENWWSQENGTLWKKALQLAKGTNLEENFTSYLKETIPSDYDLNDFSPIYLAAKAGDKRVIEVLVPLVDDSCLFDGSCHTPIYEAAKKGNVEVVKVLAPLTTNPNALVVSWLIGYDTPMRVAAKRGYLEIINKPPSSMYSSKKGGCGELAWYRKPSL